METTPEKPSSIEKTAWSGQVLAVQPRIRLLRSFDQRSHSYLGYVLRIEGTCGGELSDFLIGVGKGAHAKHGFCMGMIISGVAAPVPDERLETAGFYKTSQLHQSRHWLIARPCHLTSKPLGFPVWYHFEIKALVVKKVTEE